MDIMSLAALPLNVICHRDSSRGSNRQKHHHPPFLCEKTHLADISVIKTSLCKFSRIFGVLRVVVIHSWKIKCNICFTPVVSTASGFDLSLNAEKRAWWWCVTSVCRLCVRVLGTFTRQKRNNVTQICYFWLNEGTSQSSYFNNIFITNAAATVHVQALKKMYLL